METVVIRPCAEYAEDTCREALLSALEPLMPPSPDFLTEE